VGRRGFIAAFHRTSASIARFFSVTRFALEDDYGGAVRVSARAHFEFARQESSFAIRERITGRFYFLKTLLRDDPLSWPPTYRKAGRSERCPQRTQNERESRVGREVQPRVRRTRSDTPTRASEKVTAAKTALKKRKVIDALGRVGNVRGACLVAGISRQTHRFRWRMSLRARSKRLRSDVPLERRGAGYRSPCFPALGRELNLVARSKSFLNESHRQCPSWTARSVCRDPHFDDTRSFARQMMPTDLCWVEVHYST